MTWKKNVSEAFRMVSGPGKHSVKNSGGYQCFSVLLASFVMCDDPTPNGNGRYFVEQQGFVKAHFGKLQTPLCVYSASRPAETSCPWPLLALPGPVISAVMLVWVPTALVPSQGLWLISCSIAHMVLACDHCLADNIYWMNTFRGNLFWTSLDAVSELRSIETIIWSMYSEQWLVFVSFSFSLRNV